MHQTNGPSRLFRTPRLNVHVARRWMRALHVAVTASSLDLFHKQIFPILDYFLRAAYAFRGPLVLAVLSYLILSQPAQIQDLYFTTMSDDVGGWLRMLIIVVLLISLSIFLVTLVSVSDRFFRHPTKGTASISEHRLVKLVVGALPFAGALEGIWYGGVSRIGGDLCKFSCQQFEEYRQQYPNDPSLRAFPAELFDNTFLNSSTQILFVLLVLVAALFFVTPLPRKCAGYLYGRYVGRSALFHRTRLYRTILYLTAFCTIVFLVPQISLLPDWFVEVPRMFGALVLTLLFLIFLSAHFAALSEIGEQTGYPVISGVLATAVLFSYLDWNDNHAIRDRIVHPGSCIEGHCELPPDLPYPPDTFTEWFTKRPDDIKARFSESRYPVYIVAASGGGIYAAAQTALFLAKLYDRCPALSHHIFAISGVSGGSLGAALIAALINAKAEELGPKADAFFKSCPGVPFGSRYFEVRALEYLGQDFLSPAIASGLFPDFFQRFIPWPIAPLDRARAFERSLEQSWRKLHKYNRDDFASDFRSMWKPQGPAPMLLLNTTVVELGTQAVISPFQHDDPPLQTFFNGGYYGYVSTRFDIPLSTAVGLSARFTAIGPPGYHVDDPAYPLWGGKTSPRFVDGGYVENSGVETATAFWQLLLRSVNFSFRGPNPGPPILTVKSTGFQVEPRLLILGANNPPPEGLRRIRLNELGSPIEALLNSRAERARTAISNAEYVFPSRQTGIPFKFFKPPLGWHISHFSLSRLDAFIGTAELCNERYLSAHTDEFKGNLAIASSIADARKSLIKNHCSACRMIRAAQNREPQLPYGLSCDAEFTWSGSQDPGSGLRGQPQ